VPHLLSVWSALTPAKRALAVAAAHLVIDAVKTRALPAPWRDSLPAFLMDQAAHLATLIAAALWMPDAVASGLWANHTPDLRSPLILLTGAIVSIWGGGYAVGLLMKPYTDQFAAQETGPGAEGRDNAGRMIGKSTSRNRLIGPMPSWPASRSYSAGITASAPNRMRAASGRLKNTCAIRMPERP